MPDDATSRWRPAIALAAVLIVAAAAVLATPAAPALEPGDRGLLALHASGQRSPVVLEAVVAAGLDAGDWHGEDLLSIIPVPAPDDDPITGLRAAYAVLSAGADPDAWDDPARGRTDLRAQLEANIPRALQSSNDAVASFQLLAMAAAGLDDTGALREHLLSLQRNGSWGCGPWHGPECTGFALAALAATGGIPSDAGQRAAAYVQAQYRGGPYGDPLNGAGVQVSTWAIQALRLSGAEVPDEAAAWVLDQQGTDGMWRQAGRPSAWATAEAVVMLAGGHPL